MFNFVLSSLLALSAFVPFSSYAQDDQPEPMGSCSIRAQLEVKSIHIILGGIKGEGEGVIKCNYNDGTEETLPVFVSTEGVGLGLGFSHTNVTFLAANIGVMDGGAMALTGQCALSSVGGQLITVGGEVALGMTASRNGFSIPLGIQAKKGVGLELAANLGGMTILPLQ